MGILLRLFQAYPRFVPARLWCAVVCGDSDGARYCCSRCY